MSQDERLILVPIPALVALLLRAETDKGSPLTEAEVLAIRDSCACIAMTEPVAAEVIKKRGYDDVDPYHVWADWQRVRTQL